MIFALIYIPFILLRVAWILLRIIGIVLIVLARTAIRAHNKHTVKHRARRQKLPTFGKTKVFI